MKGVADRPLHASDEEELHEAGERRIQDLVSQDFMAQHLGVDPAREAGHQDDTVARHHRDSGKDGRRRETVAPNEADLQRVTGLQRGDQGDDRCVREIHRADRLVRAEKQISPAQMHGLEVTYEARPDGPRHQREKAVLGRPIA
jgi:hypothetical protein